MSNLLSNLFSSRLSLSRLSASRLFFSGLSISRDWKVLRWILLAGGVTRLAAFPFSMTTEQDAVARVDLARTWLENPHWILDGIWLPLQTYYMAIAIHLTQDWMLTPIALNFCFSVGTAIPLYFFTKREFGQEVGRGFSRSEASFVAAAFVLYPMAFRNSLMAMSDTPFTFFVVLGLWALSRVRGQVAERGSQETQDWGIWREGVWRESGGDRDALIAGVSITLAAALRYEGWALIPPLAIVLWRNPRQMLIFLSFALLTPLIWMAGNGLLRGDIFYSFKYQVVDTASSLAQRGGMSPLKRFVRAIFIPSTLAVGMTLPLFVLCCWGAVQQLLHRTRQVIWLLPFGFLLGLLCYKCVGGTMNLQPRYTLILGVLLLPFSASVLAPVRGSQALRRHRTPSRILSGTVLLLLLPLSYMTHALRPLLNWALADTQMVKRETPASLMEAIPRLAPSTQATIQLVRQQLQPEDALFIADLPEIGYLVLYPMGLPMSQLEIIPSELRTPQARRKAERFFRRRARGLLLAHTKTFSAGSSTASSTGSQSGAASGESGVRWIQNTAAPDSLPPDPPTPNPATPNPATPNPPTPLRWQPTPDCAVVLWPVGSVEGAVLYRYEVIHR